MNHIEARPILWDGIMAFKEEVNAKIAQFWKKTFETGWIPREGINAIGVACVGAVQKFARSGEYKATKPNLPEWEKFKEGAPPWIDTGELLNSLTYVIDDTVHEKKINEETGKREWTVK